MKKINDFYKRVEKMNKIFCDFMEKKGFLTFTFDDIDLGLGASASNDEDKFIPLFEFQNFLDPESHSIFVEDRNGSSILTGNLVAIYSLEIDENTDYSEKAILEKFKIMLESVYEKYGCYNKNNRLDFAFNEMEEEDKDFNMSDTEMNL